VFGVLYGIAKRNAAQYGRMKVSRVAVPSRARRTLPIRVSEAERAVIEAAAAQRPEYLTTYIREAALAVARRELAEQSDG
jgi:hypothetical protein